MLLQQISVTRSKPGGDSAHVKVLGRAENNGLPSTFAVLQKRRHGARKQIF